MYKKGKIEMIHLVPSAAGRFSRYCVSAVGEGEIDSGPLIDGCTSDSGICWTKWDEGAD